MPSPTKQSARVRLRAAGLTAAVLAGGGVAALPGAVAWGHTGPETTLSAPDPDPTAPQPAPALPADPADDEPQPGESPDPVPTEPVTPAPVPTTVPPVTPEPAPEPVPTVGVPPAPPVPVPDVPVNETIPVPDIELPRVEAGTQVAAGAAARVGALLRLGRAAVAPAPAPQPTETVHVDGGPDVGGSAELNAAIAPDGATGSTDAVQVGALSNGAGSSLTRPIVWAPWAGALGIATTAVVAVGAGLRFGHRIGR
ncbi:hypothetical protein [Microbacterium thalli]|uniref:hypothetical protein n=1 Tax=Microbacterium thalli TaxID=3027921 RepID=UPI0023659C17|nr:hypothetical protein [Microbacterium thalli]MDD7929849.1 hypothetical protein [Microbacterium thalli]